MYRTPEENRELVKRSSLTCEEMCECVVDCMEHMGMKNRPTPDELYNSSPSGELFHVFEYYQKASEYWGGGYPEWQSDREYSTGDCVQHEGCNYFVSNSHTSTNFDDDRQAGLVIFAGKKLEPVVAGEK